MSNLYRFLLRYTALMTLMMACMMPARAQHPFDLTTASDITNSTQNYYLMQSADRTTFYALPESGDEDSKVSTTSIPNANMRWYFMDAGSDSDHQYYYIVNSTSRCLYRKNDNTNGIRIKKTYAELSALDPEDATQLAELNSYQFYLEQTESDYYIHPKGATSYVNKKGGNVPNGGDYGFKTSTSNDEPSKWRFVAVGDVTWSQPFTISTDVVKHYYNFQNVTNTSFYLANSGEWATVSNTDSEENIWYFLDAGTDATYSNCHYYFIVNAVTNQYLYYTGGTGNDVSKVLDYNSEEGDNYRFLIVDAAYKVNNNYTTGYTIVPKLRQTYFSGEDSFAPIAMSNDSRLLLKNDRNTNNYDSHWKIEETEYVGFTVKAPIITNNFDGTISLSTATPGATIYYTTDDTTPDNTSTAYSSAFSLGDATVIKAIAYLNSEYSTVSTYNVPTYTKPTISYNNSTSAVTITSEGTVYYNTGDGSQAAPTPSPSTLYSEPFTVSSGITVKAIATHAGYLNSDVATKYIQGNDYSQNYLTFNVLTDGTIVWKAFNNTVKTIEYSINGGEWNSITSSSSGESFTVDKNDVIRFRGTNSTYATSKSNYSGFEGGSATFNIEGNIHSLLYGDDFASNNSLTNSTYQFCSLFKKALVISAENLILPATTLKNYCYRALFSWCTTLEKAPVLPATTLATGCYWYMFEQCAISSAPELNATNLVDECYGHMFEGCASLNYVKCMATSISATNCKVDWLKNVSSTGTFVKESNTTWSSGTSGIPSGWTQNNDFLLYSPEINCNGEYITITCATEGASIYYRLNQTGDFSSYSSPIVFDSNTTVEAYSTKDNNTSNTVIVTFEKYDNPFDESNRSLDSWTYGGTQVTLPFSVNGIDGHSANYSKGTHTFETTITLYHNHPTYLWFQHADQSADIYVNDEKVTTHWGGYNAFFVDISNYVHIGTNRIKVVLNNTTRNTLAPYAGDFNFNATLGKVKLFTSPYLPSMSYGYDGFHITSTVSSDEATINVKTTIPTGASVVCTITDGDTQVFTDTQDSTGEEMVFTTTITNPHLWNGTLDPHLYNVKLEIYHDNELYHRYERPYGLRFYEYVINETVNGNSYTGFLLNGQPYLLRGVCVHDDLEGKANALNDADYTQEFDIITELGCNFLRLAHYPHPKEVYDKCDQLGIVVQTEVPCVNKMQSTLPSDYYTHLEGQYDDMVNQHYNHPCIFFWGLSNETTTDDKEFAKAKIESYTSRIKALDPERMVGYVMSHSYNDPYGYYNSPEGIDWLGCNIYVGWYIDQNTNNPTSQLNSRIKNTITNKSKALAFSEYGCGGTPNCHSDDFLTTTTKGNNPRHDIEYQMWLHEGHIAAIKNYPQLLFTSQWQLFDIAVSNRKEGYTVCWDGENVTEDNNLKYLNNKGLVERDHKTKKDTYYLYKAWWSPTEFVHICGKNYLNTEDRVIKCYTNDGSTLTLSVNGVPVETVDVTDNIAQFTARNFSDGDVITVSGATTNDTFTIHNYGDNVFTTEGDWNTASNWSGNAVPDEGSNVVIAAKATVPANYVAHAGEISINGGSLTITDGGQLLHTNSGVTATVEKNISAWSVLQNQGDDLTNGWYFIASPVSNEMPPSAVTNMLDNTYDLYRFNPTVPKEWENYHQHSGDFKLVNGKGYLYANNKQVNLRFTGALKPYSEADGANQVSVTTGWNLVGNPFTCNVYANQPFYKMNSDKTGIEPVDSYATTTIGPCTGIIIDAAATGNVTFSREAPEESMDNNGGLHIALSQAVESVPATHRQAQGSAILLDNAIVSFNEGTVLPKFRFGNNAEIYFPKDGEEYAIINASTAINKIPLNFKAQKDGEYTLTISAPPTSQLSTLILIDNLTSANVDLLQTPDYTFEAKTDDYVSRFKLVFAAKEDHPDDHDDFAFVSNGEIIVIGGGTLQIFDILGRNITSVETPCHGISTNGMTPGVYVLRLMDGKKVRMQKILVR